MLPGTYSGDITLDSEVAIWGACDGLVEIVGVSSTKAAITLRQVPPDGPEGDVRLMVGNLASVVVDFLIVGFVLFLVVRTINRLKAHPPPATPNTKECPQCLEMVALKAHRCKFCTSELPAAPA